MPWRAAEGPQLVWRKVDPTGQRLEDLRSGRPLQQDAQHRAMRVPAERVADWRPVTGSDVADRVVLEDVEQVGADPGPACHLGGRDVVLSKSPRHESKLLHVVLPRMVRTVVARLRRSVARQGRWAA